MAAIVLEERSLSIAPTSGRLDNGPGEQLGLINHHNAYTIIPLSIPERKSRKESDEAGRSSELINLGDRRGEPPGKGGACGEG